MNTTATTTFRVQTNDMTLRRHAFFVQAKNLAETLLELKVQEGAALHDLAVLIDVECLDPPMGEVLVIPRAAMIDSVAKKGWARTVANLKTEPPETEGNVWALVEDGDGCTLFAYPVRVSH